MPEASRAGKAHQWNMFDTEAEAEAFVHHLQQSEPDQMFRVEAIKASTVWN